MRKRLLLIMPNFFDYPRIICDELKNMGYEPDYFDDRPSTNAWMKAAIRINPDIVKGYIEQYFCKVMQTVRSKIYDVVFVISGQSLSFSEKMIDEVKQAQSTAYFVLYQWDSVTNFPYIEKVQKYFDRCYSFDRNDCAKNHKLNFLPLFYSKGYEKIGMEKPAGYKYDFCFIGTAHPKKYQAVRMMSEQLKSVYPKQYIYLFFPSRIVFMYRKVRNKELRKAHYREFNFVPLTEVEIECIYKNSRCVLDSAQAGQTGLTIRAIESLGAKRKLITTNKDIVNYDFYREENIYIYDGNLDFNSVFFTAQYKDIDTRIYQQYSLRSWLEELLLLRKGYAESYDFRMHGNI